MWSHSEVVYKAESNFSLVTSNMTGHYASNHKVEHLSIANHPLTYAS